MKLTTIILKNIIKEEIEKVTNKSLTDFLKEFSYYRDRGVGKGLSDQEISDKFKKATVRMMTVDKLDNMGNSYTKLISGGTKEERFSKFLEFYLKEKRSKETTRATTAKDKENYLRKLVKSVENNQLEDPIVVVDIEGVGSLIAGGRTRAAAAKTAGMPVKAKVVKFYKTDLTSVGKVKKMIDDLTI